MSEIRFYHLTKTPEKQALPQIASKALQSGARVIVRTVDQAQSEAMDEALWSFRADSFVPHGRQGDGAAARQPIWITHEADNPNGATILIAASGCMPDDVDAYTLVCLMLDGRNEALVAAGRTAWKGFKEAGHSLSYWQQNEDGGWHKAA